MTVSGNKTYENDTWLEEIVDTRLRLSESARNHDGVIPTTVKGPARERASFRRNRLVRGRHSCETRNREYNAYPCEVYYPRSASHLKNSKK